VRRGLSIRYQVPEAVERYIQRQTAYIGGHDDTVIVDRLGMGGTCLFFSLVTMGLNWQVQWPGPY